MPEYQFADKGGKIVSVEYDKNNYFSACNLCQGPYISRPGGFGQAEKRHRVLCGVKFIYKTAEIRRRNYFP